MAEITYADGRVEKVGAGGAGGHEPRVITEKIGEGTLSRYGGAAKDTLGVGRTAADPLGRAVFQPKNVGESLIKDAILAPTALVGMPARIAAMGASGGVAPLASGQGLGDAGWASLLNTVTAAGAEGLMAGGAKLATRTARKAGEIAKPFLEDTAAAGRAREMYQKTFTGLEDVWQRIRTRLGTAADVHAPSLSSRPLTPQQAIDMLKDPALEGEAYKTALLEVSKEFNRLDGLAAMANRRATPTTPRAQQFINTPRATRVGSQLRAAAPERFTPRPAPEGTYPQQQAVKVMGTAAKRAERLRDPAARALADIVATTDVGGAPAGAIAGGAALEAVSGMGHLPYYYLLRHLP